MSTPGSANNSLPRIFMGRPEGTEHLKYEVLSQTLTPISS